MNHRHYACVFIRQADFEHDLAAKTGKNSGVGATFSMNDSLRP
jgi:hypothetical protein